MTTQTRRKLAVGPSLTYAGSAMFFLAAALAMTDYTGAAALVAAVAGLVTAIGAVIGNQRKQDAETIDKLVKHLVGEEVTRRLGHGHAPDSSEAEAEDPEKVRRAHKRRKPESRTPEV